MHLRRGEYFVWIHGDGLVDAFGLCSFDVESTLRVEREGTVTLRFTESAQPRPGVRAKLLLESPRDGGGNTLGLDRVGMRETCFEKGPPAFQLQALADELRTRVPFGWVWDVRLTEQTSDASGRTSWSKLPSGSYRWQLLSGERIAFDPPYEVKQFSETPRGGLEINATVLEPQVVLDIPIQEVVPCELRMSLPPGSSLPMRTNLHGEAIREADRREFSVSLPSIGADAFGGDVGLPPGKYEILLRTGLPDPYPSYFARGRIEVPCTGRLELGLERGVLLSGILVDDGGAPVQRGHLRVGFSGMRTGEWWTVVRSDESGRFALTGIPPNSTLVFEHGSEPIQVGVQDLANVTVVKRRP